MKKYLFVLIGILILMTSLAGISVQAAGTRYYYDGQWHNYNELPITLQLAGERLDTDVPPVLLEGRILVPARAIFEKLGAQVTWDAQNGIIGIQLNSTGIQLNVNNSDALVNGQKMKLDVPPKIINNSQTTNNSRTMVPVRFVGEALGFQVNWQDSSRIVSIDKAEIYINNVQYNKENNNLSVMITADDVIESYSKNEIKNQAASKVYIDIPNATFPNKLQQIPVNEGTILDVRASQYQNSPDITRVVIDMSVMSTYSIAMSEDRKSIILNFAMNQASMPVSTPVPTPISTPVPSPTTSDNTGTSKVVVVDPGHGGQDPGAMGPNGSRESDAALAVGLNLKKELEANGFKVIMTRETDVALGPDEISDLTARCNIANNSGADLFVSIHCNSFFSDSAGGSEFLVYQNGGEADKIAKAIEGQFNSKVGLYDRGVKAQNVKVLRDTTMPATLVEMAFISNPDEEALLNSQDFQKKVAKAIAGGVCDYFGMQYTEGAGNN